MWGTKTMYDEDEETPLLTEPVIEKEWVPSKNSGRIYEEGRWRWKVKKGVQWKK